MARDTNTLKALIENVKRWYANEMGEELDPAKIKFALDDLEARRIKDFVMRRLGHLPDADLIAFNRLVLGEKRGRGK